jgi:hypothetical protein
MQFPAIEIRPHPGGLKFAKIVKNVRSLKIAESGLVQVRRNEEKT